MTFTNAPCATLAQHILSSFASLYGPSCTSLKVLPCDKSKENTIITDEMEQENESSQEQPAV